MLDTPPTTDRKRSRSESGSRKPGSSPEAKAQKDRERQRRCRSRRKTGEKRFVIFAREHWVAEAMLLSGRMKEAEVLDHTKVEAALSRVVIEWIARWLK